MKPSAGLHYQAQARRARTAHVLIRNERSALNRDAEIAALPTVEWKGKTLHTILCHGTSGRGAHVVHVPPGLLYALIEIDGYLCPYHVNDRVAEVSR